MPEDQSRQARDLLERTGKWEDALRAHTRSFDEGLRQSDLSMLVSALRGQARVMNREGRYEEAEELGYLSWEIAERNGLERDLGRAINVVAISRHAVSDYDGAEQLYRKALDQARRVRDDEHIGLVCQNLGVIANIRGDLREARTLYLECIGSSVRSRNRVTAIGAYNNLGMVCTDMQEWMEAELYFDRGIEIALRIEHLAILGRLYVNRAEPLINIGEFPRAQSSLEDAERVATIIDDRGVILAAARFHAKIARLNGDLTRANEHLEASLAEAEQSDLQLEYAECSTELAHLRMAEGATDEALAVAHDARRRFMRLGAAPEVTRLDNLIREWTYVLADE